MKTYLEPDEVQLLERGTTRTVVKRLCPGGPIVAREEMPCLRDRLLVRMFYRVGYREGEALALRVEDIDFERATVTIVHLKARLRLFCPGCGTPVEKVVEKAMERQRVRTLPLDRESLAMLAEYIQAEGISSGPIFRMGRTTAWNIVHSAARKAGLGGLVNPETGKERGISPHRLRDAFATTRVKRD